eukprot:311157-Chlamydomonas_euryale.AAC.1
MRPHGLCVTLALAGYAPTGAVCGPTTTTVVATTTTTTTLLTQSPCSDWSERAADPITWQALLPRPSG